MFVACCGARKMRSLIDDLLSAARLSPSRETRGFAPPPRGGFAFLEDSDIMPPFANVVNVAEVVASSTSLIFGGKQS
jgi:hypothetical protein